MTSDEESAPKKSSRARVLLLVVILVGIFLIGHALGVTEYLTRENIRAYMERAGLLGFAGYLLGFSLAELVHVPGVVFVVAAVLAYGKLLGFGAAYIGGIVATSVSFYVVRGIGGQPLAAIERPFVKRLMDRLEDQPIRVIAILRVIFWVLPALNYALAMSGVRFRDYLIGTAMGLVLPFALASFFIDRLLVWTS